MKKQLEIFLSGRYDCKNMICDWLKRDVSQMGAKASDGISKCKVYVSSHFLQTLEKYEIKQSGLYCHLSYGSAYLSKIVYKEHDYAKEILSYDEIFQCLHQRLEISGTVHWFLQMLTDQAKKLEE